MKQKCSFSITNDKGLSNYPSNQAKKDIQKSEIENLDIILSLTLKPCRTFRQKVDAVF